MSNFKIYPAGRAESDFAFVDQMPNGTYSGLYDGRTFYTVIHEKNERISSVLVPKPVKFRMSVKYGGCGFGDCKVEDGDARLVY